MRVLFSDPHVTVSLDEELGLVRYTRSNVPYVSVADVHTLHEQLIPTIPTNGSRPLKLLLDSRDAPPRNDPEFETAITRALQAVLPLFAAHAFLLKSAAGRLQGQRLARQRNASDPAVFATKEDALRYLGIGR